MIRIVLVAVSAACAACSYGGSFIDCEVACTSLTGCPPGFTCSGSEGLCRSGATTSSCGGILDGGVDVGFDGNVDGNVDGGVDGGAPLCPAAFGGGRYLFVNMAVPWSNAEAYCKSLDSTPGDAPFVHLVVVSNTAELGQLVVLLSGAVEDPWLGYTDSKLNPDGLPDAAVFQWVTDEPGAVAMWGSGQPDNSSGPRCPDRDAGDGLMHDNACTSMRTILCECDQFPEDPTNL